MKIGTLGWAGAAIAGVVGVSLLAQARRQDDPPPPTRTPEQIAADEAQAEMMRKAAAPGPMHELLAKRAGEWTFKTAFTVMAAPEPKPVESEGKANIRSIHEGRFLLLLESGDLGGMPFTSTKLIGYNSQTNKYEATWVYTGSTAMMHMTGTTADEGKTVEFDAEVQAGDMTPRFKIVMRSISDDSFSVDMRGLNPDGTTAGHLLTTYTRKK